MQWWPKQSGAVWIIRVWLTDLSRKELDNENSIVYINRVKEKTAYH